MTELLDRAVRAARDLPAAAQDDIARLVLRLARDEDPATVRMSADERAAVDASKAAAARGDFASDEEVRAVWAKHGL